MIQQFSRPNSTEVCTYPAALVKVLYDHLLTLVEDYLTFVLPAKRCTGEVE